MITVRDLGIIDPWDELDSEDQEIFHRELRRELHPEHSLYGKKVQILARRYDQDDILVSLVEEDKIAIVHLTWAKNKKQKDFRLATTFQKKTSSQKCYKKTRNTKIRHMILILYTKT